MSSHEESVIRYIGCIGVATSMRSLKPEIRAIVAKESINRLCESRGISRSAEEKSQHDDINQMLDNEPNLLHSGKIVELCITTTHLNVLDKETKDIIVQQEMANVSFASSDNNETSDFVAYVAKNPQHNRSCFVLQCSKGSGKKVLDDIARGFKLRTQQIKELYNTNTLIKKSPTLSQNSFNGTLTNVFQTAGFNDISLDDPSEFTRENAQQNEAMIAEIRLSLNKEPWFHGCYLTREESEARLKQDGDFLVRESMLDHGHFVLSVMNDGTKLHLLFDTMGQVRTRELVFDNISELVSYHHKQGKPIVAENRVIYLKNGVRPSPRPASQVS